MYRYSKSPSSSLMMVLIVSVMILIPMIHCQCNNPNYIIPATFLDNIFDKSLGAVRSTSNLINLVINPNQQEFKAYFLSVLPAAAPLFAFAGLTLVFMIVCISQVCCFKICNNRSCGNQIDSSTYSPTPIKIMMITFMVSTILIVGISIAAIVLNTGLITSFNSVNCNTQNIVSQTYKGSSNVNTPWAGVNLLNEYANQLSTNFQNTVPGLTNYFSNTSTPYNQITSTATGSLYANSQIYNCVTPTNNTITCPFPTSSTCSSTTPVFSAQFCSNTTNGSSLQLISAQMATNSTTWLNNIKSLSTSLATLNSNVSQITTLTTSINSFVTDFNSYQTTFNNAFDISQQAIKGVQIALYVFYSLIIVGGIMSLITIAAFYYGSKLGWECWGNIWWIFFSILSLIMFAFSGFLVGVSIAAFDSCSVYNYFFISSSTNFQQLSFANQTSGKIFKNCFFNNAPTIFVGFLDQPGAVNLNNLVTQYNAALTGPTFRSVVATIEASLFNMTLFPQTIALVNQTDSTNSPLVAYNQANTFSNFSANGSTQSCKITKDNLVFNPVSCYPYLSTTAPPSSSCVIMQTAYNFNTVLTARNALFSNCTAQGTTYTNNANALFNYGLSVNTLVNSMVSITANSSNSLQVYQTNYFNYYVGVNDFFSSSIRQQFLSFVNPFNQINSNSSCAFITQSTNAIVDISCNQLFPYINSFTILNIVLSALLFVVMCVIYFLVPRFAFYVYLDGNYQNLGVNSKKIYELPATELTNRNDSLLQTTNPRYV